MQIKESPSRSETWSAVLKEIASGCSKASVSVPAVKEDRCEIITTPVHSLSSDAHRALDVRIP